MSERLEVLLYRLGAIGSFYAFILSRSSRVRLTVVARSNYEAVKEKGLLIKSQNHGEHLVKPANVLRTPAEANQTFDYIVCAHKAVNQDAVPNQLASAVSDKGTTIVLIQNGVGNEDPFLKAFPQSSIIGCVTWVGATVPSPGVIDHGKSEDTQLGIFHNPNLTTAEESKTLEDFTSLLREGGTPFQIFPDIQIARWEKVVWNAAWNSITTLTKLDTHTWLNSSPEAIPLTRKLMQEVIDVARKCNVDLKDDLIDRLMERILAMPGIYSSMYQDSLRGNPMEVEVILGTPVKRAREMNVAVPMLEIIYAMLHAMNEKVMG